jgi:peroxiredoxin
MTTASDAPPRRLGALFGLIVGAVAAGAVFIAAINVRPSQPPSTTLNPGTTAVKLPPPIGIADGSTDVNSLVGRAAPGFTLSDSEGRTFPITPGGTPLVLVFDGNTPCDPCEQQLFQLQKSAAHIHDHADVFVISDKTVEDSRRFKQATGLAMPLLLDPQLQVTRMYDMRAGPNQTGGPTPGVMQMGFVVVDGGGVIRTHSVDTNFGDHADQIIQILHNV